MRFIIDARGLGSAGGDRVLGNLIRLLFAISTFRRGPSSPVLLEAMVGGRFRGGGTTIALSVREGI